VDTINKGAHSVFLRAAGDTGASRLHRPPVATVEQDGAEMGQRENWPIIRARFIWQQAYLVFACVVWIDGLANVWSGFSGWR
jgi:hypothetical protein